MLKLEPPRETGRTRHPVCTDPGSDLYKVAYVDSAPLCPTQSPKGYLKKSFWLKLKSLWTAFILNS